MATRLGKILVVDDDPQICKLIGQQLTVSGFDSVCACDPKNAKELIDSERFDVVIIDITMPQISSLDLLAYTKQHNADCKVVLVTGYSNREYLAQALKEGAYDYIEKPFEIKALVNLVGKALLEKIPKFKLPEHAARTMEENFQTRQAAMESAQALVCAVEAKDPFTKQHSDHVTFYATSIAQAMMFPEQVAERIRIASLLHDIGKIGVPDYVLTKEGPLGEEEFRYIRRHPGLGADILSSISVFAQEAVLVRHHHESWDGKGYPDGLANLAIPLGARIIQISDCIDGMLMERSYKKSYPVEKMLYELGRCKGTQFDPMIAEVAIEWCRRNSDKLFTPARPIMSGPAVSLT